MPPELKEETGEARDALKTLRRRRADLPGLDLPAAKSLQHSANVFDGVLTGCCAYVQKYKTQTCNPVNLAMDIAMDLIGLDRIYAT